MSSQKSSPAIGGSPVQGIRLVQQFVRRTSGLDFNATSRPGHLIQYVVAGRVHEECNGRHYDLGPGSIIWYHEDELVRGIVQRAPWTFYSINFLAPTLPPPAFENRLFTEQRHLKPRFAELLTVWEATELPAVVREFRTHAILLQILAALTAKAPTHIAMDPVTKLWWDVETECRRDLRQHLMLPDLAKLTGRSPATISRSCFAAVGMPPMKRLKQVRMSLAHGLVRQSSLAIKEIADQLGYARVHEFSRDYRKAFSLSPTHDRRQTTHCHLLT